MAPPQADNTLEINAKDSGPVQCLKLAAQVDWRALLLVLAAIGGFGGAIWNRVDAMLEKALANRTQQGVYELLATRMDAIATRLDALEQAHKVPGPVVPTPGPVKPAKAKSGPVTGDEHGTLHSVPRDTSLASMGKRKALRPLPSYAELRSSAHADEMPALIERAATSLNN